jgi:hypothetical protein
MSDNSFGGPSGTHLPGKYYPGIVVSEPHTSAAHPELHRDIEFNQGRLPGQLPLPFPKIHFPVPPEGPK